MLAERSCKWWLWNKIYFFKIEKSRWQLCCPISVIFCIQLRLLFPLSESVTSMHMSMWTLMRRVQAKCSSWKQNKVLFMSCRCHHLIYLALQTQLCWLALSHPSHHLQDRPSFCCFNTVYSFMTEGCVLSHSDPEHTFRVFCLSDSQLCCFTKHRRHASEGHDTRWAVDGCHGDKREVNWVVWCGAEGQPGASLTFIAG